MPESPLPETSAGTSLLMPDTTNRTKPFHAHSPARPSRPEACGLRHLAFAVASVEETLAWLQARGVATEPVRIDPYTKRAVTFFADPDGLPIEIYETG
jgi:glyoxylase I family protein